ncbi:MAG: hypothetical protein A2157_16470 [Deltaproteobacteria bacterium RBG_16_47_11]|nr:MAG: hypothetical protein A2157_16470 [Deltaproteobacteria bacterium RBG_16_47_11]
MKKESRSQEKEIRIDLNYLRDLTKKMVKIPSPPGKEKEVALFIASELERIGIKGKLQRAEKDRYNVFAKMKGKTNKSILFQGHMDTIPDYGWKEAFWPKEKDGRIYGRGSVDMKSSIACAIAAMKALVSAKEVPEKTILLAGTVDEETEKRGIFTLIERGVEADMGVCCEPTDLKIGLGHKGNVPLRVSTKGRATHGSTPEAGVNAVYHMGDVLAAFEKNWRVNGKHIDGIGHVHGTYSVGIIRGGESYFVVSDQCHIWIDRRTIPGETKEDVKREVEGFLNPIKGSRPEFQYEIALNERPDWKWPKIIERGYKSVLISPKEEIVRLASSSYKKVVGSDPEMAFLMYWTEADFLVNEAGIPTIIFGPGEPAEAHSTHESIAVSQLERAARIYLDMMMG